MAGPIPSAPAFDPAYKMARGMPGRPADTLDIETGRRIAGTMWTAQSILEKHTHLTHTDITIPGVKHLDDHSTTLAVFQTKGTEILKRAVVLYVHGGGQVVGDRFHAVDQVLEYFIPLNDDLVFASIEYRLAPEHPAPAAAYDAYAGAVYLFEHAAELRIDPARILIYGVSGGGPIAAATCLLARRFAYPQIRAQMLCIPMLHDGDHWISHRQLETGTLWPGRVNQSAWDMVLGPERKQVDIDEIRCPGRATDLSDLPRTFIDIGECEVFRDSAVAFASQMWKDGGSCELHVFPGLYHGGALFEPDIPVSRDAQRAQTNFLQRALDWRCGSSDPQLDMAKATL